MLTGFPNVPMTCVHGGAAPTPIHTFTAQFIQLTCLSEEPSFLKDLNANFKLNCHKQVGLRVDSRMTDQIP